MGWVAPVKSEAGKGPAAPPLRPSSTAALGFASSSVISPVAIFATMTAAPITSAGRFSPLVLLALVHSLVRSSWHAAGVTTGMPPEEPSQPLSHPRPVKGRR
jgi:hypothetical protein